MKRADVNLGSCAICRLDGVRPIPGVVAVISGLAIQKVTKGLVTRFGGVSIEERHGVGRDPIRCGLGNGVGACWQRIAVWAFQADC